jgi:hypothetical protein
MRRRYSFLLAIAVTLGAVGLLSLSGKDLDKRWRVNPQTQRQFDFEKNLSDNSVWIEEDLPNGGKGIFPGSWNVDIDRMSFPSVYDQHHGRFLSDIEKSVVDFRDEEADEIRDYANSIVFGKNSNGYDVHLDIFSRNTQRINLGKKVKGAYLGKMDLDGLTADYLKGIEYSREFVSGKDGILNRGDVVAFVTSDGNLSAFRIDDWLPSGKVDNYHLIYSARLFRNGIDDIF